jgi:outer membrane protein OmpA-like peptidoglycan-associated protein
MKTYLTFLFMLALAVNAATAQRTDGQRDTLRQRADKSNNDLLNAPISSNPLSKGMLDPTMANRYGVFGGASINNYSADFRTLPGVPNCCSRFTEGDGIGAAFGFLAEFPLTNEVVLGLRATYASQRGIMKASEFSVVGQGDSVAVPALFEHTVEATPSTVGFAPIVGYRITKALQVHAGPEFAYQLTKQYHQYEKLVEPETGHFTNGKRIRNDYQGDLPEASAFQAALVVGTSYEFALNKSNSLIAAPEAFYAFNLTPVVHGLDWYINSVRVGMSLKFAPENMVAAAVSQPPVLADVKPETVKAQEPKELPNEEPVKTNMGLNAAVTAMAVGEGGVESPLSTLYVEDIIATNRRPLLNYVFFDENSASIPDRYKKLSKEEAGSFKVDQLDREQTLPTYYNMLNIIGQRLRENPSASITLVGTNANLGAEQGNKALSTNRANAVRDYLSNVWNISPNRMNVQARNLPAQPSNLNDPDGVAENRRVELLSSDPTITEPLFTTDTLRRAGVPMIRFRPNAFAQAGVADWSLVAKQDGKTLRKFVGTSEIPEELDWNVDAEQATTPRAPGKVEYSLEVRDAAGQVTTTPLATIPVEHTPVMRKRPDQSDYKQIDRFSMILFDYDKAELNSGNRRVVDMVKSRISPNATVSITGHTDRIGDAEYNRQLSEDRAHLTASVLNASTSRVTGVGENEPQYTNDLPEGRFYNRTVDVLVETPVK